MADVLFLLVFVSAVAFNAVAWWRFKKTRLSLTSEQKKKSLIGLLANLVAFVFPFVYGFSSIFTQILQRAIRWDYVLVGCWILCALAFALGALGPRQVRLPLMTGGLAIAAFWTMVPLGVL